MFTDRALGTLHWPVHCRSPVVFRFAEVALQRKPGTLLFSFLLVSPFSHRKELLVRLLFMWWKLFLFLSFAEVVFYYYLKIVIHMRCSMKFLCGCISMRSFWNEIVISAMKSQSSLGYFSSFVADIIWFWKCFFIL